MFIGEVLALDLVNTEVIVRGKPRDLLATPEDVVQWWRAAQRYYPDMEVMEAGDIARIDTAGLAALKRLRAALRGIFGSLADRMVPASADIDVVNSVLRTGVHALMPTSSGDVQPVYQAQPPCYLRLRSRHCGCCAMESDSGCTAVVTIAACCCSTTRRKAPRGAGAA